MNRFAMTENLWHAGERRRISVKEVLYKEILQDIRGIDVVWKGPCPFLDRESASLQLRKNVKFVIFV
jgi:hypothetical protein